MKKILIAVLASAVLASTAAVSLTACGGGGTEPTPEVTPSSQLEQQVDTSDPITEDPVDTSTPDASEPDTGADPAAPSGSQWNDPEYTMYTAGLAEPTVNYVIKGVLMDQLTLNLEVTEDELASYKQSLLDAGFEAYRDGEGSWGMSNETHNIQMNGYYDGIAYVYIGLQQ